MRQDPRSLGPRTAGPFQKTICVVPAYRARDTICSVVEAALSFASMVIVVDDACPDRSADLVEQQFGLLESVVVIRRLASGGPGAATKTGIERALELGAGIIVKLDADDPADAARIPQIEALFEAAPDVAMVKGNRFADPGVVGVMSAVSLIGNAVLSIWAKLASGYWSVHDPSNGLLAFNARTLRSYDWRALADSEFFALDALCSLGLRRAPIVELEMTAVYGPAPAPQSVLRALVVFPTLLFARFARRVLAQYVLLDVNAGSLCLLFGLLLTLAGGLVGARASLALMWGLQLLFAAGVYDVLRAPSVRQVAAPEAPAGARGEAAPAPTAPRRPAHPALALLLPISFVAWFAIVASRTYVYLPTAWEYCATQAGYALRVFGGLPRNVESLLLAGSFVFSAILPGYVLTGWARVTWSSRAERLIFAVSFGLIFYTFAFLVLGATSLLKPTPLFALTLLCTAGSVAALVRGSKRERANGSAGGTPVAPDPVNRKSLAVDVVLGVALAFFLFVSLLGGLMFEIRFDASWYHLAEARRWALEGSISDLLASNRSLTAGLPHYQEVLYAGLISMFGVIAAKVFAWFALPMALLAMSVFAARYVQSRTYLLLAAVIFASTPIISYYSAGSGSNDLPLAPITLLAVYALLRWNEAPREAGWIALAGALCGYSIGLKTTGLFAFFASGCLVVALVLARRRSSPGSAGTSLRSAVSSLLVLSGSALVFAAPSLIQAALWTRDPVFPVFALLFNSPYDISYLVAPNWYSQYVHGLPSHVLYLLTFPWWLTFEQNSIVGPIFLVLAPGAVIALFLPHARRPAMLVMAAFCAVWAAFFNLTPTLWFRYAEAIAPLLALLVAYPLFVQAPRIPGWNAFRAVTAVALAVMLVMNMPFTVPFQSKADVPGNEGSANFDWNYLYRNGPPPVGAPAPRARAATIAYLNASLPAGARVYEDAELFPWTLYVNAEMYEPSPDSRAWTLQSPEALDQLRRNHVDYVVAWLQTLTKLKTSSLAGHLETIWSSGADATGDKDVVTVSRLR
jgi:hypothetical protein